MESSTRKSLAITLAFSVFTLIVAIAYWFAAALGSMGGGPDDDIAILRIGQHFAISNTTGYSD